MHSTQESGFISIFTPSSVNISDDPDKDDTDLLPCFATLILFAATTSADAVEIFNVLKPSPPVPTMSMAPSGTIIVVIFSLMARTAPMLSSIDSP